MNEYICIQCKGNNISCITTLNYNPNMDIQSFISYVAKTKPHTIKCNSCNSDFVYIKKLASELNPGDEFLFPNAISKGLQKVTYNHGYNKKIHYIDVKFKKGDVYSYSENYFVYVSIFKDIE